MLNGWRNVFNSYNLSTKYTKDYSKCRLIAEGVNYKYFIFDGYVYSVEDLNMSSPICTVNALC